jgi:hypothetical protein
MCAYAKATQPTTLNLCSAHVPHSPAELTITMKELGDLLTANEIARFVKIMDKNNNGVVDVSAGTWDVGNRDVQGVLLHCPATAAGLQDCRQQAFRARLPLRRTSAE